MAKKPKKPKTKEIVFGPIRGDSKMPGKVYMTFPDPVELKHPVSGERIKDANTGGDADPVDGKDFIGRLLATPAFSEDGKGAYHQASIATDLKEVECKPGEVLELAQDDHALLERALNMPRFWGLPPICLSSLIPFIEMVKKATKEDPRKKKPPTDPPPSPVAQPAPATGTEG
jgi:hypothetical protein